MIPVQTTFLRPRNGIVLLALIPVLVMVIVANTVNNDTTLKIASVLMLLIPVAIYIFVTNSYVEFDNEGITYKNPFKTRTIRWKDVTGSYMKVVYTGKSSKRVWYFENDRQRWGFATNLYSRASLRSIAEALLQKAPHAAIQQKIREIAEGKFPWYIF